MPDEEPPAGIAAPPQQTQTAAATARKNTAMAWFRDLIRGKTASNSNSHIQEALDDFMDELKESVNDDISADNQKTLITNVLKTHDLKVSNIMIPRADIVAIDQKATHEDIRELFRTAQFSRIPVYDGNMDTMIGILHIKDLLACLLEGRECHIRDLVREVNIVSPGMTVMDLLATLREDKKYMALVVDEHGGIDGLVTLNDVIEAIMGEIEDEFDIEDQPQVIEKADGSIVADARMEIEDFEERYGSFLNEEEREDIETLGGLAFALAGRVPKRGETLKHRSGMVMDVMDANASRVTRVRLRNLSPVPSPDEV